MKCYFFGSNLSSGKFSRRQGIISFSIPDYGVLFRSQYFGTHYDCEYAALLALIRFVQLNKEHFKGKKLKLLSDSALVIYQVNRRITASGKLLKLRDLILFYQKKLKFDLEWIPGNMNRAEMTVDFTAPNLKSPKFNYDIFDDNSRKAPAAKSGKVPIRIAQ